MAKNFRLLYDKLSPAAKRRTERWVAREVERLALRELREAKKLTQEEMASRLKVEQAAISKLERRQDMYLSTLNKYVSGMGGKLEVTAVFPSGSVSLLRRGSAARIARAKRAKR
jgi:DNA-binding XRE family transcriptional regulator